MQRGYNSKRVYRCRLKSNMMGWRQRLQTLYSNYGQWKNYSDTYGLAKRLGFKSAKDAYDANPIIEGGLYDSDFQLAPSNPRG
jgi:hypothetical protein